MKIYKVKKSRNGSFMRTKAYSMKNLPSFSIIPHYLIYSYENTAPKNGIDTHTYICKPFAVNCLHCRHSWLHFANSLKIDIFNSLTQSEGNLTFFGITKYASLNTGNKYVHTTVNCTKITQELRNAFITLKIAINVFKWCAIRRCIFM